MATPSRYLEAPRRLRAFVRAHETSLVVLAAMIGTIGGLVVLAMSVAVAALHALLFNISIKERLSSQPSIETLRAVLVPSLGGLLLGVALLVLLRSLRTQAATATRPAVIKRCLAIPAAITTRPTALLRSK